MQSGMRPLRFVVLSNGLRIDEWQADCVRQILAANVGTLVGVVVKAPAPAQSVFEKWKGRWTDRRLLTWRLFNRLFVTPFSKATRASSLVLDDQVPVLYAKTLSAGRFAEKFDHDTIAKIQELEPDFILRFGFGILTGDILSIARYGLWSYHHGDHHSYRGQPPGFWEIYNRESTAGAMLQVLSEKLDAGRVLHKGQFSVTAHSYARTRDTLYFGASSFVARACNDILLNGFPSIDPEAANSLGKVYKQPTTPQVIRFAFTGLISRWKTFVNYRLRRQTWNCAAIPDSIAAVAGLEGKNRQEKALGSAIWMTPGPGEFFADPFGLKLESGLFRVFFERFDWRVGRGDIATSLFDGKKFGDVATALNAPTHLSYPFVTKKEGGWVFVPEHSEARDVSSFTFDEFGVIQSKCTILGDTDLIDTTILYHDGRYWIFAIVDGHAQNTHLHILYGDTLDGPWTAHPLNPVKSDVTSARPAGTPFFHNGKLYRPAQDCSRIYGGAVTINEIVRITPTDYREIRRSVIKPVPEGAYIDGLHTLSEMDGFTLIDGAKRESKFL
ncbi:formyltransferase family protein [Sphingomonas floccifaciens]|uniref:Formyltransferase family protein n=1 Tax=Sphingomonas floccifaciens TaxID=1844115 RepID=A0ABW4ND93_9SPHN